MMQGPKACGIFHIAPYFAISLSIVLLLINVILFDSSPHFSDYHYVIKNKRKQLRIQPSINPLSSMMHVNSMDVQHGITELSEKILSSANKLGSLKIYVYNLPPRFNYELLRNTKSSFAKFDSDYTTCNTQAALHKHLLTSSYRVHNPSKADFFYVPVYGSCRDPLYSHMDNSLKIYNEALVYIKTHFPFFNSSYGRDHVWILTATNGAMKKLTTWQLETKNCILLFCGIQSVTDFSYTPHKDVVIPPSLDCYNFTPCYELPASVLPKRKYLVHIAGSTYGVPHTTKMHSNNTRMTYYFRHLFSSAKVKVSSFKSKALMHDMMSSVFCLCPTGTHGWARMYYLSIFLGCIPVLFDTDNEVAFQDIVDPSRFTVQVRVEDIDSLKELLQSISNEHTVSMQNELERIWKLFYYGSSGLAGEVILKSLVRKKSSNHIHYQYYTMKP